MTKEITDLMSNLIRMKSTLDTKQKSFDDNRKESQTLDTQIKDLQSNIDSRTEDLNRLLQELGKGEKGLVQ
jgi:archaellum component FlaC